MPPGEIPWRLVDELKKKRDKHRDQSVRITNQQYSEKISGLTVHWDKEKILKDFPEQSDRLVWLANQAISHNFSAFDLVLRFDNTIEWHLDPVTKKCWPKKFWGEINYRDTRYGGVKFVWEINRLYCLFPLAFAYRLTQKTKYAKKAVWYIQDWLKANPYPMGINWTSGIEMSIRLANLVWMLAFIHPYRISDKAMGRINAFVFFHATHLLRYPSRYSSANNHLIAEGFGLFLAGLYFPGLPGAEKWFAKGKTIIEQEAERQILDDGGSFEYSTTYLSFVVDFFLLFSFACDTGSIPYSKVMDRKLRQAMSFISTIMDKAGNIPNMGDQDSAVLVNFGLSNLENCSSLCNTGALRYGKKSFHTGRPDIKTWLLTGKTGSKATPPGKSDFQLLEPSGLCIMREIHNNKELLFTGNAMPLGMPPLFAHGHLDALSFTLSIDGLEFFVDTGTYCYHGNDTWRTYFRSTSAHNTLRVMGKDMSEQIGDFMFGKPYKILENRLDQKKDGPVWRTTMASYSIPRHEVRVTRQANWLPKASEFIISDSIESDLTGKVEIFFHLHPQCRIIQSKDGLVITRQGISLTLEPETGILTELIRGSRNPVLGWYSPEFNKKTQTTTIRQIKKFSGKESIVNRIRIK